jgi:hypothetical protein
LGCAGKAAMASLDVTAMQDRPDISAYDEIRPSKTEAEQE